MALQSSGNPISAFRNATDISVELGNSPTELFKAVNSATSFY